MWIGFLSLYSWIYPRHSRVTRKCVVFATVASNCYLLRRRENRPRLGFAYYYYCYSRIRCPRIVRLRRTCDCGHITSGNIFYRVKFLGKQNLNVIILLFYERTHCAYIIRRYTGQLCFPHIYLDGRSFLSATYIIIS